MVFTSFKNEREKSIIEKYRKLSLRNNYDFRVIEINFIENDRKIEKDQLIAKVEETNNAVNLLCLAVSALIDDSLLDNEESKNRLKEIKRKLDSEKEII